MRPGKFKVAGMKYLFSIAALTVDVKAGAEIQLLPAGEFRARDGRPNNVDTWRIDAKIAARIIALAAARQTPFVIDYEHQTLLSEKNGQPAPAAGWFKTLEWRDGQGLFATDVTWTDKARAMIDAGEYKFLSPVFGYDPKTGAVRQLLHAALTNVPALDGMAEVAAAAARLFDSDQPTKEKHMPEFLKKLLGLADDADEKAVEGAVTALKAKADKAGELETEVAALKTAAPDPAKFVPADTMKALQTEVATLTAQIHGRELEELIKSGLQDGRILPAMEAWARDLGKKDVAQLKGYLDNASPVAALKGTQTGGKGPQGGTQGELSEAELTVCKQMGIDPEAYKKEKAAEAA